MQRTGVEYELGVPISNSEKVSITNARKTDIAKHINSLVLYRLRFVLLYSIKANISPISFDLFAF